MARAIVLRQLTGQARTRAELARKLAAKDIPDEVAESVLGRMTDVGLIDDHAFARSWVESRQQRRHLSRNALRQELQRKGVDRDLISSVVDEVDADDEYTAAYALAERKARSMSSVESSVRKRRLAGALARRGFSSAIARQVLEELAAEPDEFAD